MASDDLSNDERTETATAFRREEFRKQGMVALSRELVGVALLLGVGASLYAVFGNSVVEFSRLVKRFFSFGDPRELTKPDVLLMVTEATLSLGAFVWPALVMAVIVGAVACIAQVGFQITWEPMAPKLERLDPTQGFKRLFSGQGPMEAGKALLKVALISLIGYRFFNNELGTAGALFSKGVGEGTEIWLRLLSNLFFSTVMALSVVAAIDYAFQRWRLEKQMRMTKREVKEEFKLREGDPLLKSRIRAIQGKLARQRMMEAVPKADVVITNPTHFAVALKYDATDVPIPKVIAKGAGAIALKIKELAKFHHVPVVENRPLARTLYKELEVGEYIPRELYKAVAQVLSYVFRLKGIVPKALA